MRQPPAVFLGQGRVYQADTCEPLKRAARRGELRLLARGRRGYPGTPLPAGALDPICSLGVWDARRDQAWGLPWHRNEGIEFTCLSRGRMAFHVGERSFPLRRGHLTITRPWQVHRVGEPHVTASRLHWIILDVGVRRPNQPWRWPDWLMCSPADLKRLTRLLSHNEEPVWRVGAEVERCFEQLSEAMAVRGPAVLETRIKLRVNELLVTVADVLERKRIPLDRRLSGTPRTVELFLEGLRQNLEYPWDLGEMARQCGLGRTRFVHYCRLVTDLSPGEYLARCRVEAAARILGDRPDANITDVGLSCGFGSGQYFATVFRRFLGCTPSDYRRRRAPSGE